MARSPGPLEVEPPQPSGDVDDLANEEQARNRAAFEGFRGKFGGVDAAEGDLGLGVAFVTGGLDGPSAQLGDEGFEILPGKLGEGAVGDAAAAPGLGQAIGPDGAEGLAGRLGAALPIRQPGGDVDAGQEVDVDGRAGRADRGNLEDGRAAEPAMGEEDGFAEAWCFAAGMGFISQPAGKFALRLNGAPLLDFNVTLDDATWRSTDDRAVLRFLVRENGGQDSNGVLELEVAADLLKPANNTLEVTGSASDSQRWFGIYGSSGN